MQMSAPGAVTTQQGSGSPACSLIIFHSTECGATSVVALALTGADVGGVEEVRQSVSLPVSVSGQPVSLQSD